MTILALGTYDLLHVGHLRFLKGIKRRGPCTLIVAVNTDEFAARFKRPPIISFKDRWEMLDALPFIDGLIPNDGLDQPGLIARVAPCRIVHGDDWTGESYFTQLGITEQWANEHKVEVMYVPYTAGISTSEIIERCRA